jgi:hypothetical protein
MQSLKDLMEWAYSGSKERFTTTKNTLVSQCAAIINKNNMSLEVNFLICLFLALV